MNSSDDWLCTRCGERGSTGGFRTKACALGPCPMVPWSMATPERRSYLQAAALGLDPRYYSGLIETLRQMDQRALRGVPSRKLRPRESRAAMADRPGLPAAGFSMSTVMEGHTCGTVGCIMGYGIAFGYGMLHDPDAVTDLGWSDVMPTFSPSTTGEQQRNHSALVAPPYWHEGADAYTVEVCREALRRYLTTGHADYPDAVVDHAIHLGEA